MLPVNENAREARQRHYPANPDIRLLNDALRQLCAARPHCRYLDAWPEMSTQHPAGCDRRWTAATACICLPWARAFLAA